MRVFLSTILLFSFITGHAAGFHAFAPVTIWYDSLTTNSLGVEEVCALSADGTTVVANLDDGMSVARIRFNSTYVHYSSLAFHYYYSGGRGISSNGDVWISNWLLDRYPPGDWGTLFVSGQFQTPSSRFWGCDVSADGLTLAGNIATNSTDSPSDGGFIATSNSFVRFDGTSANGLSADGQILVGSIPSGSEAFYATTNGGIATLGFLPSATSSVAYKISADNQTIIGESGPQAFRWTAAEGMVGLGYLPGGTNSSASALSADGTIIVGFSTSTNGKEAMIWDATNGMRSLKTVLENAGVDLAGLQLTSANAISADGQVIAGNGVNSSLKSQTWIASFSTLRGPTNLTARFDVVANKALLTWQVSAGAAGYRIERKAGTGGTWFPIADVTNGVNSYTDDWPRAETNYTYRVIARSLLGSAPSNETPEVMYRLFAFQNSTTGNIQIWSADGINLVSSNSISTSVSLAGWRAVCLNDLNKNGLPDILLQNTNGQVAMLSIGGTKAGILRLLNKGRAVNKVWSLVGAGDYNHDGNPDLVWQHRAGFVSAWFMKGTNLAGSKPMIGGTRVPAGWKISGLSIFPHDTFGKGLDTKYPDFLLQDTKGRLAVWYLHGLDIAHSKVPDPLPSNWRAVGAFDVDGDGESDVLAQTDDGRMIVSLLVYKPTRYITLFNGAHPGSEWRLIGTFP